MDNKFLVRLLWFFKPLVIWIDRTFSVPFTKKRVTGREFYAWQDVLKQGCVFITDAEGHGSNLINPSEGKHGAIYYGQGLRSDLNYAISSLVDEKNSEVSKEKVLILDKEIGRLSVAVKGIEDDIPYVIEAVEAGVVATDLVTFLASKDRVRAFQLNKPSHGRSSHDIMAAAARYASLDIGLSYDYGFANTDTEKYCFEVIADAFKAVAGEIDISPDSIMGQDFYLSNSIFRSKDFDLKLDSDTV